MLLSNLPHMPAFLSVVQHGGHGGRLPIDEHATKALAEGGIGVIGGAGKELLVSL